jgi:hypothetical protein
MTNSECCGQGKLKDPATLEAGSQDVEGIAIGIAGDQFRWAMVVSETRTSGQSLVFPDFDDNLRQAFNAKQNCFSKILCVRSQRLRAVERRLRSQTGGWRSYGFEYLRQRLPSWSLQNIRRGLLGRSF